MASVGMVSLFDERSQRRMTKQQTGGYDLHRLTKIGHQDQENVASLASMFAANFNIRLRIMA